MKDVYKAERQEFVKTLAARCDSQVLHTRRYPRTLTEAFGPYASAPYVKPDTGNNAAWWLLAVSLSVALVVLCFSQA